MWPRVSTTFVVTVYSGHKSRTRVTLLYDSYDHSCRTAGNGKELESATASSSFDRDIHPSLLNMNLLNSRGISLICLT